MSSTGKGCASVSPAVFSLSEGEPSVGLERTGVDMCGCSASFFTAEPTEGGGISRGVSHSDESPPGVEGLTFEYGEPFSLKGGRSSGGMSFEQQANGK